MAHESFEDADTAAQLNADFVAVKVDREERPDVDAVYMAATQALTGHGGWPMSVFLDHDRRPFYAGTYWPREDRGGHPGFRRVLHAVHEAWTQTRDEVTDAATRMVAALAASAAPAAEAALDPGLGSDCANLIVERAWDRELGGFGRAPKFPQAMTIAFLLAHHARTGHEGALDAAVHALDAMARGGIFDQVGGGFARYSTDARWLVPHFEKMLYDNALLLGVYAEAAARTGRADFERVARATADYLLIEMQHPDGGFYSATDADSEGVEGKFFVWDDAELREVVRGVGLDPDLIAAFYGCRSEGNFTAEAAGHAPERANILHEPVPREAFAAARDLDADVLAAQLAQARLALYQRRQGRVPPGLDDKILTSWNALAIRALARAGALLAEPRYVAAAQRAATFVRDHLVVDGRLHHTFKDGRASVPAFLEDVGGMAAALIELAAAAAEPVWLGWARELAQDGLDRFADGDGGYYQTAHDAERLVTRPREAWDSATPAGSSLLVAACWQLALLTGEHRWHEAAEALVRSLQSQIRQAPTGFGELLQTVEALAADTREIAIVGAAGPDRDRLARVAQRARRPGTVLAIATPSQAASANIELLAHRDEIDGGPAVYVCRGFVCDAPVTTSRELDAALS